MSIQAYYQHDSEKTGLGEGFTVRHADHIAQMAEARRIIEAYRVGHIVCAVAPCDTCKVADKFLEEARP